MYKASYDDLDEALRYYSALYRAEQQTKRETICKAKIARLKELQRRAAARFAVSVGKNPNE